MTEFREARNGRFVGITNFPLVFDSGIVRVLSVTYQIAEHAQIIIDLFELLRLKRLNFLDHAEGPRPYLLRH